MNESHKKHKFCVSNCRFRLQILTLTLTKSFRELSKQIPFIIELYYTPKYVVNK